MNQKERMLAQLPYKAWLDGLPEARETCARKVYEYNHLPPERWGERPALLRSILGKCGESAHINPPFHCDYGTNIEVGENFFANYNLIILDVAKVTIGKNVSKVAVSAFFKTPKLKTIVVKGVGLKKSSVKGMMKGSKTKALVVKVPKKAKKAYKKVFTKANLKAPKKVALK